MNEGCGYKRKGAEGIATNQNISDYATGVLMFSISTWHRCVFCVRGGSKIQGGQSGHGPHPVLPWNLAPPSSEGNKIFSLNFPNFCDYFVKKVVSEIRKCCQLQGASSL